jgi:hypothetical protein
MSCDSISNPKHCYDRAAEMRALAETMANTEMQAVMGRLANDYDKLADRAQARADDKRAKDA